jgi:hypothetical protein
MHTRLLAALIGLSGLALTASLAAHESGYVGDGSGLIAGGIFISSGTRHGPVFTGAVGFGQPYFRGPVYYPQPIYFQGCGHWHAPDYRHGHGYANPWGYAQGHSKHHGRYHWKGHHGNRRERGYHH